MRVHLSGATHRTSQACAHTPWAVAWIVKTVLSVSVLGATIGETLADARPVPASELANRGDTGANFLARYDLTKAIDHHRRNSLDLSPQFSDGLWFYRAIATISGPISATVEAIRAPIPNHKNGSIPEFQPTANTFACLDSASDVVNVRGTHKAKYTTANASKRAFDARSATFLVEKARHGAIASRGDPSDSGMCWAGGYVYSSKPWDASWADHKDLDGPTRNSSVFNNASYEMTLTGMHFFNVHDGPRSNNADNWTVQHVWGEYIRDDCIENDHLSSGRVSDSLFDGCYTGISTRSSGSADGRGHVVTIERVLLRLQPMPYPYKWRSKGGTIDENGNSYNGLGIPYGHGKFFKYQERNKEMNNHFVLKDSVFAASFGNIRRSNFNLPHPDLIDQCEGVTVAWLADSPFRGGGNIAAVQSKFPACITILEGQEARAFWRQKVIDWHRRHPDVGGERKPTNPGEVVFPQKF